MTRAFRILTFQAAIFAACALTLGTLATMTKAAPAQTAAVQIDNFTFKQPVLTVKPGTTVICWASMVRVSLPASALISSFVPTAMNRLFFTANA